MNWPWIGLFLLLALLIGGGALAFRRLTRRDATPESRDSLTIVYVLVPIALILTLGALLATQVFANVPEIQFGFMLVIAIIALITLLFIVAAGFAHLKLTDPKQALGLPEGSVRSMIALILIMVFIIFGIYLFRKVGSPDSVYAGAMRVLPETMKIGDRPIISREREDKQYDVWILTDVSADGQKLAQQLMTTVGTLVVAIASFYFGSTTTTSAANAGAQRERADFMAALGGPKPAPSILAVQPNESKKGAKV